MTRIVETDIITMFSILSVFEKESFAMKAYMEPEISVVKIEYDVVTASGCPRELPIIGEDDILG